MQGILLLGHGYFASGLSKASEQIIGKQENFCWIDFTEEMSTDELNHQIALALTQLKHCSHITILTDLLGGSPFRCASLYCMEQPNIQVISGTNLQMLIEALLDRESLTFEALHTLCLSAGHHGITSLQLKNQAETMQSKTTPCEGI